MEFEALLNKWQKRAVRKADSHAACALRANRYRYIIGVPSVILSTVVGTAVFAQFQSTSDPIFKIVVVAMVLLSAALTSLQTFFNFGQVAESHMTASRKYAQIRRTIEKFLHMLDKLDRRDIEEVERAFNEAKDIEPSIPDQIPLMSG